MQPHLKYTNPYTNLETVYKGNLHSHCAEHSGCSSLPIRKLIHEYKNRGYNFLAITDHDYLTKIESFADEELLLIPGFEFSTQKHMQLLGINSLIQDEQQAAISQTLAQNGLVIMNHPNWGQTAHLTIDDLGKFQGFHAIEIFNGIMDRLKGHSLATTIWDEALTRNMPCWGIATDDSHEEFDIGRGWIMVFAESCDTESILNSIRKGNFYASTGAELSLIKLIENKIHVETAKETAFRFVGPDGKILKTYLGTLAEYWIEGWEDYVRIEGWNKEGWFWTQPFFGE